MSGLKAQTDKQTGNPNQAQQAQIAFNDDLDVRIATIGNVDAGKSTIVGVLTQDKLDDGRGSVRQTVFNFKQELDSGRASSIG